MRRGKHTKILHVLMGCVILLVPVGAAIGNAAQPGQQVIAESRFVQLFSQYIQESTGRPADDIVVSRFKVSGNQPVPAGPLHFRVLKTGLAPIKGHVRLGIIIDVGGVVRNRVTASGWVDIFKEVVFAGGDLKKGRRVVPDDLYLERVNITRMPSKVLTDISSAVGHQCKHSIRAGTALKQWMLERIPVVSKGDVVLIVAQSAGIRVTVPGRIMETGYENEQVAVENIMSKKRVFAKVIDGSTVIVEY